MALDELQDQKPFGAHWSRLETVWRCEVVKNTAHLFRNKFPVNYNYRSSWKEHFKFPGNLKPILGNESIVSLWRKRHYLSKRTKRWRGFPPDGFSWSWWWWWWILGRLMPWGLLKNADRQSYLPANRWVHGTNLSPQHEAEVLYESIRASGPSSDHASHSQGMSQWHTMVMTVHADRGAASLRPKVGTRNASRMAFTSASPGASSKAWCRVIIQ